MIRSFFARTALALILALALAAPASAACYNWSMTAGTNATADPSINWAEGMAPSSVNDSARAMMARLTECRLDKTGSLVTTGTSTALILATNQGYDTLAHLDGEQLCFRPNVTTGTPVTLNVDGLGAKPLRSSSGIELSTGTLVLGAPYCATYNNSDVAFYVQSFYPQTITANSITTSMLQANAVTYAKLQAESTNTLLGNVSGGSAVPSEITIGAGLSTTGTTLVSAYPPVGSFSNLVIKVTGNTTASATASGVTVTDGTTLKTVAPNCTTIDLGTTGINALDTGSIATSSWYSVWVEAKADGTTGCAVSLQATANATFLSHLPTGYTFYARVGWLRTSSSVAQLRGTFQYGRRAQYILGLAQTTAIPIAASGSAGDINNPTWVSISLSTFVPTTASEVIVSLGGYSGSGILAPNNSYGNYQATTNPPTCGGSTADGATAFRVECTLLLENAGGSPTIYWANNLVNGVVGMIGWVDNL